MKTVVLQPDAIDIARVLAEVGTDADGAVVSFIGRARNTSNDKSVIRLEYETYGEMARSEIGKIVDDACAKWPISSCAVVHRYGPVAIGEASVLIVASSPHRRDAFQAVQYIIDTIKQTVPIWKKEFYSDGSAWINGKGY